MTQDILKAHPSLVLSPARTLRHAMQVMTRTRIGIALVVDRRRRLLGLITDIDIRRALLHGVGVNDPVTKVMNPKPITIRSDAPPEEIAKLFRETPKGFFPIVDDQDRLKSLATLDQYATIPERYPNWVVIMAGGIGKRLRPLTNNTPKPMLRIGGKPILELIVEQFVAAGFSRFVFAVNYLADQIHGHFGDGGRWNARIEYVREPRPMGTAGPLRLIKRRFDGPVLVANGDILTKVNLSALLEFHRKEKGLATICVKRHEIQVPYGVVQLEGRRLHSFVEKPVHRLLVNAGIYVIEPKALAWLPRNKPTDMPDLLRDIGRRRTGGVACFPIEEYWLDIGGLREYERAAGEYSRVFERP